MKSSNNITLFVRNVPYDTNLEEIQALFSKYGQITAIRLPLCKDDPTKLKGICFVDFASPKCLSKALELDGFNLRGRFLKLDGDISFDEATNQKIKSRTIQNCPKYEMPQQNGGMNNNQQMLPGNFYSFEEQQQYHEFMMNNAYFNQQAMNDGAMAQNPSTFSNSFNQHRNTYNGDYFYHQQNQNNYVQPRHYTAPPGLVDVPNNLANTPLGVYGYPASEQYMNQFQGYHQQSESMNQQNYGVSDMSNSQMNIDGEERKTSDDFENLANQILDSNSWDPKKFQHLPSRNYRGRDFSIGVGKSNSDFKELIDEDMTKELENFSNVAQKDYSHSNEECVFTDTLMNLGSCIKDSTSPIDSVFNPFDKKLFEKKLEKKCSKDDKSKSKKLKKYSKGDEKENLAQENGFNLNSFWKQNKYDLSCFVNKM